MFHVPLNHYFSSFCDGPKNWHQPPIQGNTKTNPFLGARAIIPQFGVKIHEY